MIVTHRRSYDCTFDISKVVCRHAKARRITHRAFAYPQEKLNSLVSNFVSDGKRLLDHILSDQILMDHSSFSSASSAALASTSACWMPAGACS